MGCQKILTIKPDQGAMPLDQAIYASTPDKIYGVRGGYVYEFNPTTGAKISSSRYASPAFSSASIAWDSVNNKLFCSVCNDKAFDNTGSTDYDIIVARKLFRLVPATLAVDASAEMPIVAGFPGYIGTTYEHAVTGPHRLLYSNGVLLCAGYRTTDGGKVREVNVNTLAITTSGQSLAFNEGEWMDMCIQPAGAEPEQLWIVNPYTDVLPCESPSWTYAASNYYSYEATDYAAPYNIIYGICWCPSNGKIYGTCRKPTVVSFVPNTVGSPFALTTINTGDASATPYRICYNAYDGFIYVPGLKSNNVVVINPATDTVVAIRTGFDSPFDCVFTPTKKWAVQQGDVPLLEIT